MEALFIPGKNLVYLGIRMYTSYIGECLAKYTEGVARKVSEKFTVKGGKPDARKNRNT